MVTSSLIEVCAQTGVDYTVGGVCVLSDVAVMCAILSGVIAGVVCMCVMERLMV